jgi:hypothetical protein
MLSLGDFATRTVRAGFALSRVPRLSLSALLTIAGEESYRLGYRRSADMLGPVGLLVARLSVIPFPQRKALADTAKLVGHARAGFDGGWAEPHAALALSRRMTLTPRLNSRAICSMA